jgi:hypothetical protein
MRAVFLACILLLICGCQQSGVNRCAEACRVSGGAMQLYSGFTGECICTPNTIPAPSQSQVPK